MGWYDKRVDISDLLGQTILSIAGMEAGSDMVSIITENYRYNMFHYQDCCENVYLADVIGDPQDLIGKPVLMAECVSNADGPTKAESSYECEEWTFYKLATLNGYVTLRWYGSSNGYYSTNISIEKLDLSKDNE